MQRFFADTNNNEMALSDETIHHLLDVTRIKINEQFELCYNGEIYLCKVKHLKPFDFAIIEKLDVNSELPTKITLFFGLAKGDKIDFVIQKATELGASEIILVNSKNAVNKMDNDVFKKKIERYTKIAINASEQSHRNIVPEIKGIVELKDIKNYLKDINFVAYEKKNNEPVIDLSTIRQYKTVSVFIGPEGGFNSDEIDYLNSLGFQSISLGKRILRCETAAIYALSVLGYNLEK